MTNRSNSPINTVRTQTARLLATENITVIEDPKAPSAYFDLKSRTLALPVWKDITQEMYDMLVGHEVGHALFTPNGNGGWVDSAKRIAADAGFAGQQAAERAAQSFLNIVEDARIERLIKDRYPGLRRDFFQAYTEFAKRDIFKIGDTNLSTLGLADRLNIHFKIGFTQPVPFSAAERKFVERMEAAVTWDDVVAIAADLFSHQAGEEASQSGASGKPQSSEADSDSEESAGGKGNGDGASGQGESGDTEAGKNGSGDAEGESDANGAGESGESGEESGQDGTASASGKGDSESQSDGDADLNDSRKGSSSQGTKGHGVNTAPVIPSAAQTASSLDDASNSLRDGSAAGRNYIHLPKSINSSDFVISFSEFMDVCRRWESGAIKEVYGYKMEPKGVADALAATDVAISEIVKDTASTIQAFVREFEMLKTADEHRRTVESKSGRLDMDQAWKYRISEDLFKTATTMRDGKSHGFVMFIDWSGSMDSFMAQTMRQLYILFQFCKKVGIPFDVYAFGAGFDHAIFPKVGNRDRIALNDSINEINPRVDLLHIMSSRSSVRDLQDAFRFCLTATRYNYNTNLPFGLGGSTPLDSTVVIARDIINDFRKATKVQIVNTVFLTDGDATDNLCAYGTLGNKYWNGPTILREGHREWATENAHHSGGTGLLLRWLKDQTQANTIGIFITGRFGYASHHFDPSNTEETRRAAEKQFKSDGWTGIKGLGFDQYFVMSGISAQTEAAMRDFQSKNGAVMTATQIKNAYIKAVEKRNGARGLIHRFVKIVA